MRRSWKLAEVTSSHRASPLRENRLRIAAPARASVFASPLRAEAESGAGGR